MGFGSECTGDVEFGCKARQPAEERRVGGGAQRNGVNISQARNIGPDSLNGLGERRSAFQNKHRA